MTVLGAWGAVFIASFEEFSSVASTYVTFFCNVFSLIIELGLILRLSLEYMSESGKSAIIEGGSIIIKRIGVMIAVYHLI